MHAYILTMKLLKYIRIQTTVTYIWKRKGNRIAAKCIPT